MTKYKNWLAGPIIEQAQEELYNVITLLTEHLNLTQTSPFTTQALLASCIIPGQVIKTVALKHPETISIQQKQSATTHSLVTNADHLAQMLADYISIIHLEEKNILNNVYFNSEETKTKEYQQFFAQKKYQIYFTLPSHAQKSLDFIYQREINPNSCKYLSNLDPLDGTSYFKKWLQNKKTEYARWTVAHTFLEIAPNGRITPLATVIHNPVINKTYLLEKESNTFIAIDSNNKKIVELKENQDSLHRLIISNKPLERTLQLIDKAVINELTTNEEVAHRYSETGSIFDTCEVIDSESATTCTYSLAVGGLHDLHIPLWKISASANLLCPELKPFEIDISEVTHPREYTFAFGPARDIKLFYNPQIRGIFNKQLRSWHDDKLT